jgi:hypothetical protein
MTFKSRSAKSFFVPHFIFVVLILFSTYACAEIQPISEVEYIGNLIFKNECDAKDSGLITWNEGENFPSLGIGHFIWYPQGKPSRFQESFPELLSFLESKGVRLPDWFSGLPGRHAPWTKRSDFIKELNQGKLDFLKEFLIETKPLQAEFMVNRFRQSMHLMLQASPIKQRLTLCVKISMIINSENGIYPLVDYVNFNGEGLLESERYKGEGWGLLQVLKEMQIPHNEGNAILEFVNAADKILKRRVENSPKSQNQKKWLLGWENRIHTYLTSQTNQAISGDFFLRKTLFSVMSDEIYSNHSIDIDPDPLPASGKSI